MIETVNENKLRTRLYLFLGSVFAIVVVSAFLVILNINEPAEYTEIPLQVLLILTVMACIALAVFFAKGRFCRQNCPHRPVGVIP